AVLDRRSGRASPSLLRLRTGYGLAGDGADLRGGLAQRLVDRLDDLLTGLEGPHRGDHVDHRARGIGAGALELAALHDAGGGAGGSAGDERVALLDRVRDVEDADGARVDRAVGGRGDPRVVWAPH